MRRGAGGPGGLTSGARGTIVRCPRKHSISVYGVSGSFIFQQGA
jgi:hypothetical protein